ncbi:MAG: glycosyltransferase family 4 protein [Pseudomonadales bacterium]
MPSEAKGRLLLLLDGLYPCFVGGGGAENQVRTLAKAFTERGVEVTVVVPMLDVGVQKKFDSLDGIAVYRVPYPKIPVFGGIILYIRLFLYLLSTKEQYDVVHAHIANHMAATACLASRFTKRKTIVKLTGWLEIANGILSDAHQKSFVVRWMSAQFKRASVLQAISQEIVDLLIRFEFDADKVKLIPNAVDTNRFTATDLSQKREQRLQKNMNYPFIGVFVGRLVAEKCIDDLIQAWSRAFSELDAHLVIVGGGPLELELKALAAQQVVSEKIHFVGGSERVEEYLSLASVGLLPSRFEGLSNTLLEYMACGLPVIGSRVSGTQDLVDEKKNGLLIEPGNVDELTAALEWMHSRSEQESSQLSVNARNKVVEYAGIDSVVDQLLQVYSFATENTLNPGVNDAVSRS